MNRFQLSLLWIVTIALATPIGVLYGQDHGHTYGKVDFALSCNEQADEAFNTGLALLHHMMYRQAEAKFSAAAEADPNCAMAHWGVAMSVIHPLWGERPSDGNLEKGREAIAKATALNPPAGRESAYIAAVEPFFRDWKNTAYPAQLAAFEKGYRELHQTFPGDIDAAAFYALGHLATAPKADKTFTHQKKAGALLEELHARAPEHPGLFHYIIHSYDNPMLAERAVEVARAYDKIAPEVPHALHMPSHIFVRQGLWPDVIDWNNRSAAAALRQPVGDMTSMHYAHALDYLMYAYLQRGEDAKAKTVLGKINSVGNLQQSFGAAYAVAAMQARHPLERNAWTKSATVPLPVDITFPLENYPAAVSILHYARGLGAARSGDTDGARAALESLDKLHAALADAGEGYWAVLTDAQRTTVAAWLAYADDDKDRALALMREAADKEDSVDKHPVTPGHVLPARELLGDMLSELGQPAEALKAYEASLELSANRFNSLFGAGLAAERSGDKQLARRYYTKLVELSSGADTERPAVEKARKYLASN